MKERDYIVENDKIFSIEVSSLKHRFYAVLKLENQLLLLLLFINMIC